MTALGTLMVVIPSDPAGEHVAEFASPRQALRWLVWLRRAGRPEGGAVRLPAVGISAVCGDGSDGAHAHALLEAAVLARHAPAGHTVVTDAARAQLGGVLAARCQPLPPVQAAQLCEPLAAWRLSVGHYRETWTSSIACT